MMGQDIEPPYEVLVVLDPNFGERLKDWWPGRTVWIVVSAANRAVAEVLSRNAPGHDHLTGISELTHYLDRSRERCFLAYLDTIDLHHGPMSANPPYTIMTVIGTPLTPVLRGALGDYGFSKFEETPEGFAAFRNLAEASRIRD